MCSPHELQLDRLAAIAIGAFVCPCFLSFSVLVQRSRTCTSSGCVRDSTRSPASAPPSHLKKMYWRPSLSCFGDRLPPAWLPFVAHALVTTPSHLTTADLLVPLWSPQSVM